MTLKALIWDVDGTLAETEEVHRKAFNLTFAEHGYDWEWSREEYKNLLKVTGGVERISHFLKSNHLEVFSEAEFDLKVKGLHLEKTDHYVKAMNSGEVMLREGVERLLLEARKAGIRLAIATTTSFQNIEALINHSPDLVKMEWFEAIGAGGVIPHKKPAPDIFHWTLEALGLPAKDCIAMEDSRNGLKSAMSAGIPTVITYSDYTSDQDFSGALAVANCLGTPDIPAKFLSGTSYDKKYIDIDLLRTWHADAM